MSNTEERVKKIVAEQLGVKEDEVKTAASFVEDEGPMKGVRYSALTAPGPSGTRPEQTQLPRTLPAQKINCRH